MIQSIVESHRLGIMYLLLMVSEAVELAFYLCDVFVNRQLSFDELAF